MERMHKQLISQPLTSSVLEPSRSSQGGVHPQVDGTSFADVRAFLGDSCPGVCLGVPGNR